MSYVENMRQRVLIGQLSMILYSALAAVLGKTWKTFTLAFLLIIIVQLALSRRGTNPLGQRRAKAEEILQGKRLFEEENARDLQMEDRELLAEMQEQGRFSLYTSLGMLIVMIYFFVFWPYVDTLRSLFLRYVSSDRLALFLAFLVYFEGVFVLNQITMVWALRKVGKMPVIQMHYSYVVTDKGIVTRGIVGKGTILFPLPEDAVVRRNDARKFVEIEKHGRRTVVRLRFYTRRTRRLEEILRKYGGAKRAGEKG